MHITLAPVAIFGPSSHTNVLMNLAYAFLCSMLFSLGSSLSSQFLGLCTCPSACPFAMTTGQSEKFDMCKNGVAAEIRESGEP